MKVTLLAVSGEGCAGCAALLPLAAKLAKERGLPLEQWELNDKTAARARELGVCRVPALLILADGKAAAMATGYQPEEILSLWLDAKLEEIGA